MANLYDNPFHFIVKMAALSTWGDKTTDQIKSRREREPTATPETCGSSRKTNNAQEQHYPPPRTGDSRIWELRVGNTTSRSCFRVGPEMGHSSLTPDVHLKPEHSNVEEANDVIKQLSGHDSQSRACHMQTAAESWAWSDTAVLQCSCQGGEPKDLVTRRYLHASAMLSSFSASFEVWSKTRNGFAAW
jgi:hypothetical protein